MNVKIKNRAVLSLLLLVTNFSMAGIFDFLFKKEGIQWKPEELMIRAAAHDNLAELYSLIQNTSVNPLKKYSFGSAFSNASAAGQRVIIEGWAKKLKIPEYVIVKQAIETGHSSDLIWNLQGTGDAALARILGQNGIDPFATPNNVSLFEFDVAIHSPSTHFGIIRYPNHVLNTPQSDINKTREVLAEEAAKLRGVSKLAIFREAARRIGPNKLTHGTYSTPGTSSFDKALGQNDANMVEAFIEEGADTRNAERDFLSWFRWQDTVTPETKNVFRRALKKRTADIDRTLASHDAYMEGKETWNKFFETHGIKDEHVQKYYQSI